jgi:16S rRNA (cytosine967-C5)-methyltransferase
VSTLANQRRLLLELLGELAPHWRRDARLPERLRRWQTRHRAGGRDRRLYRELTYTTARILPWVEAAGDDEARVGLIAAEAADTPATRDFRAAYARPDLVAAAAPERLFPFWCREALPAVMADPAQRAALLTRAPLWLRLQTDDPTPVAAEFEARGWTWSPSPVLPAAWRLPPEVDVTTTEAHRRGWIEVQDLGSQLILARAGIAPGETWLDACAGAGGKTLQLARLLGTHGRADAHDVRSAALDELMRRATRAGLANIARLSTVSHANYDGVLVDAPCSGTGTWRRAPHLKWCTSPRDIRQHAARQSTLLARFASHVRPGGRLIYATCSLCPQENDVVVNTFLASHARFTVDAPPTRPRAAGVDPGHTLLPAEQDTDGFYTAYLRHRG